MSHILAVSGMHITYLIIGIHICLKNIIGTRNTKIITIILLVCYLLLIGLSASVVRAVIMGIMVILSKLLYRKSDIATTLALSLLVNLMYNPYSILQIGLQFSYGGTIGILFFQKNILKIFQSIRMKKKIMLKNKWIEKLEEILSVTFSAQMIILPLMLFHFNIVGIYFFITNILVNILIGPIVLLGFVFCIVSFINTSFSKFISIFLTIGVRILVKISLFSQLPFAKIYISTPKIWKIILFYLTMFIFNYLYSLYQKRKVNMSERRIKNLLALFKYKFRENRKKWLVILQIIIIICLVIKIIPKDLKIYFIDVGQGDSTFIVTPNNKTILIDGGGSISSDFDVGKRILLPYILDRGFSKIDYIFISHFDQDHVAGLFEILEELKIEKVYISKQIEKTENYEKFIKIVKKKKINVHEVKAGNRIQIEKNLYFDILWPIEDQITTNVLNNNAIVCNLHYKNFSMLFTGDIEEISEKQILKLYSDSKKLLKTDILKVAHHGSKTSSTSEFLNAVKAKFAVIGVGKNNNFGHPSQQVIQRLQESGVKVYRTDENGEISIIINRKGQITFKFFDNST